jgi:hypothetical protein
VTPVARVSPEEVAGLVCATLQNAGITVTLTGGGCVAIWSEGKYVSRDLDFIEEGPVSSRQVKAALAERPIELLHFLQQLPIKVENKFDAKARVVMALPAVRRVHAFWPGSFLLYSALDLTSG